MKVFVKIEKVTFLTLWYAHVSENKKCKGVKNVTFLIIFPKISPSYMFDCLLNAPLSLDVNKVCFDEKPISLIRMKNQQKIKVLLNGTDVVNVVEWTKKCRVLVLPWSRSCGILWINEYEIRWYQCSHSENLRLRKNSSLWVTSCNFTYF